MTPPMESIPGRQSWCLVRCLFNHPFLCHLHLNMASLNTSINGPSIKSSYQGVVNSPVPSGPAASSPTYGQWAVFSVSAPLINAFQQDSGGKESVLKVQSTGGGQLSLRIAWCLGLD
jgi:hypothetical protein